MGVLHPAVGEGLARLDGDLPQIKATQGLHSGLDVVFFAHRHTAAGQDQVMRLRSRLQRSQGGIAPVRHDAQIADLTAQPVQKRAQEKTVGVVNAAGFHLLGRHLTRHDQLIPGRKQGHARPARHLQAVQPDARRQAERSRCQARTARQHHSAPSHVLTSPPDPPARLGQGVQADGRQFVTLGGQQLTVFLHHNSVGASGNRGAGEDPSGATSGQRHATGAGSNPLAHRQHRARAGQIGAAQRIAVHRAVVLRRHLQSRHQVLCQHAAVGIKGRHRLHISQGTGVAQQFGKSLIEGPQRGQRRAGRSHTNTSER